MKTRIGPTPDWPSALRELAIIICGVLIALAANAWWEARTDRSREGEYLTQLSADLTGTLASLDSALAQENATTSATNSILLSLRAPGPINADSLHAWTKVIGHYSDPRIVLGTINALQETGDLRLIRDRRIRVGVSAYANGIAEDWAEFSRWVDLGLSASRPVVDEAIRHGVYVPGALDNAEHAITSLRADPELMVAMRNLLTASGNRRDYVGRMRNETERLLAVVNTK